MGRGIRSTQVTGYGREGMGFYLGLGVELVG